MAGATQDRILQFLKMRGRQTTAAVARHVAITPAAARKHLDSLQRQELVAFADAAEKVGRPVRYWSLTESSRSRFPDSHEALTLELITAAREAFGEDGIERLIGMREAQARLQYMAATKDVSDLPARLAALAGLRTDEGYMAEVEDCGDHWLLIENHCPICAAAQACQGFCRSELQLFRDVLAGLAQVERTEHILAGARRCAYRITPDWPAS